MDGERGDLEHGTSGAVPSVSVLDVGEQVRLTTNSRRVLREEEELTCCPFNAVQMRR